MAKTKDTDQDSIVPDGLSSLGAAAGIAAAKTPCEVMGENEILPHEISVKRTDQVSWRVYLCNTPARAVLGIADAMGHQKIIVNQAVPPPNPLTANVMPPPAPLGRYMLLWLLFPTGPDWQMVVEVAVNGVVLFRQYKSSKSTLPTTRGFLFMEVDS